MVIIILAIFFTVTLVGLIIEAGIASWNIRRANRYRRRGLAAERDSERAVSERQDMEERLESLDDYASKISWLLNFLYNRYDKFADLETEVLEGLKGVTEDTPIGEADAGYKDLKKALKLIRVTVKTSERMENLVNSTNAQISQIIEDFRDEEEEEQKPESPKPNESAKGEDEKSPEPEASETPEVRVPDAEVPAT